jgi:type IV pilus assembly protein PilE
VNTADRGVTTAHPERAQGRLFSGQNDQGMVNMDITNRNSQKGFKGFTLIELMVVVAIVAILMALAIPSYSRYVRKANRGEAQQLLMNWANNQEIWRSSDTDYATIGELPLPTHDKYTFSLPVRGTNTYTLRAVATGTQVSDEERGASCTPLELNQSGVKSHANCW